jgi:hypothetical protein
MTGTLIAQRFNLSNRANLWTLREYHGTLEHTYCDPLGRLQHVTGEHADRLIAAGKNVYVEVPFDDDDQYAPKVSTDGTVTAREDIATTGEDDIEQARRLA